MPQEQQYEILENLRDDRASEILAKDILPLPQSPTYDHESSFSIRSSPSPTSEQPRPRLGRASFLASLSKMLEIRHGILEIRSKRRSLASYDDISGFTECLPQNAQEDSWGEAIDQPEADISSSSPCFQSDSDLEFDSDASNPQSQMALSSRLVERRVGSPGETMCLIFNHFNPYTFYQKRNFYICRNYN